MRTRWPLAALLVLAVLAAGLVGGSASQLGLAQPARPLATSFSRCSGNTLTITGTAVAVSGIDAAACSGKQLTVHVRSGGSTLTVSGTISAATATLTLPSAVTSANGVAASIATWLVPVNWSVTPGALPAASCVSIDDPQLTCSAAITELNYWGYPTTSDYNATIRVTSTSTTPVRWQVTINLSNSAFPMLAKKVSDTQGGLVKVSASACTDSPRLLVVKGTTSWGPYHQVSAGNPHDMQLHGHLTGTGGLINCT